MNRTALSIQMLHILYGRNTPIQKKELASMLETNPRNIAEFKKELETAGYMIASTTGKHGGYRLLEESIFPSLTLNEEEKKAIQEALQYLQKESSFLFLKPFSSAMNKLYAKLTDSERAKVETIYLREHNKQCSEIENEMFAKLQTAKEKTYVVTFCYRSLHRERFEKREVQPYEMVVSEEGMYVLAYDCTPEKSKEYKFFKVSEERMQTVDVKHRHFHRDSEFRLEEHTGKYALWKDLHEVELEVYGIFARLLLEQGVENTLEKEYKNGVLRIRFLMEGESRIKRFVLSLGKDCKVLSPISLQESIQAECEALLKQYNT